KIRAIERPRRRIERDMAQRAADAEVLVPAEELIQRDHDGPAPARIRRVHRATLRRRAFVLEDELRSFFAERQHHAIRAAVAWATALDVRALANDAVGYAVELFVRRGSASVDDPFHPAL